MIIIFLLFKGNLGSFFITNIRVVWYAATNELFNASIPFLQIGNVSLLYTVIKMRFKQHHYSELFM